ncbi:DUF2382 domain-containing protein [Frigoribacterium sp. MEB024]|uniref:DUF2382 domain-containing protein n=1 Tax=Frigoribacterium sp. MEB024 TaxID=1589899 RepID=UPI0005B85F87|nr:PRC and DUF2382 domain-containing protein [Frigoribacterium sp. MEB024]KIU02945.1 hypothetical protein SZ60_08650 [Frigoribacterium sp. MEB024]
MISTTQLDALLAGGGDVIDQDGKKIGGIGQVYLDDQGGEPAWVTVTTGLFGTGESFAPLAEATVQGDDVHVPVTKAMVKDAPHSDDADGHLSPDQESDLFRYYHLDGDGVETPLFDQDSDTNAVDLDAGTSGTTADSVTGTGAGHDTSGPDTDDAMTRSEERLHVGTETTVAGRARLRKYVVSEQVTETVPVERVQLGTETVTEQQQVTEEVRHEEIDLDGDDTSPDDTSPDGTSPHR